MRIHRLAVIAVAAGLVSTGCADSPSDSLVTGVQNPLQASSAPCGASEGRCLIDKLFPDDLQKQVLTSWEIIEVLAADPETLEEARSDMFVLVQFTLDQWYAGVLGDKPSLTSDFVDALYLLVGFAPPGLTEMDLANPSRVQVIGPSGGTITTANQLAGTEFPPGAVQQQRTVVITPLPFPTVPGQGPLPTTLPQYPLFYDVTTYPPGPLNQDIVVGVCVVDPPDPFAPPPSALPRLRLGHESSPGVLTILPLAGAPFLSCSGSGSSLNQAYEDYGPVGWLAAAALKLVAPRRLIAEPGGLGGATSSLSPFGAVDPGSQVATITISPLTSGLGFSADPNCSSEQRQLVATALDDEGDVIPDVVFTWSSSSPGIASVDQNGVVTAVGPPPGTGPFSVTIGASVDEVEGIATVKVEFIQCGS